MRESIYICAGSLCCTLVVCSLLRIISPTGSTQKIMSVVICVFSLCCLVSPIYELSKNFSIDSVKMNSDSQLSEKMVAEYDSEVLETTAEYINEYINTLLVSLSVDDANIETVLSSDHRKGIYIKKMNIYLNMNEKTDTEKISEMIFRATGIEPNIMEIKYE